MKPGVAQRSHTLFLPKTHVHKAMLEGMLSFGDSTQGSRGFVRETPHHFEVPRYTVSDEQLAEMNCPLEVVAPEFENRRALRPKPGFSLRENQLEAWAALRDADRGILNLACGKGKTVLGLMKAAYEGMPTLIVSPQKAHLDNWIEELRAFFDYDDEIGWVQGKLLQYDKFICMATVQTLAARVEEGSLPLDFFSRFGLVIYDECHIMAAEFFSKASSVGAGIRIGLTATPVRTDRCEGIFYAHLGPVFFSDVSQDLVPTVYVVDTGVFFSQEEQESMLARNGTPNVGLMHKMLEESRERNALIQQVIDECRARGRIIYALSHGPAHLELLHAQNPGSTIIHGGTQSAERLRRLNSSDLVFASVGVGAAAYNRKELDTLLLLTPFAARKHSAITLQQSVGRILRALPGKKTPWVFLFLDKNIEMARGMVYSLVKDCERRGYRVITKWKWSSL